MRGGERARVAERVRDLLGVPDPDEPGPRFRWEPSRRAVVAVGGLVVVVAVLTLLWWRAAAAPPGPVAVAPAGSPLPAPSGAAPSSTTPSAPQTTLAPTSAGADIVVDVDGRVRHPGLYRLPAGSRVDDAVRAAGGVARGVDTVSINLAAPVQDGQQIVVGVTGPPVVGGSSTVATSGAPASIDLNSATLDELETLPGVGPVLGQKILDWRTEHGRFDTVGQLDEVSGVGPATLAELTPLVTVG